MGKPSNKTADEKARIVVAVLKGELTAGEAARRHGVSEQSVHNWKGCSWSPAVPVWSAGQAATIESRS